MNAGLLFFSSKNVEADALRASLKAQRTKFGARSGYFGAPGVNVDLFRANANIKSVEAGAFRTSFDVRSTYFGSRRAYFGARSVNANLMRAFLNCWGEYFYHFIHARFKFGNG